MEGYTGKILDVDLARLKAKEVAIDEKLLRRYIGGRGLGVRLLWEAMPKANISALSPENVLIFSAGPFTGFPLPGASRTSIVTKSPATSARSGQAGASTLSIGQMPGHFSVEMKYAGYDCIIVRGKAKDPVSLIIKDDSVEFRPSFDIWGKEPNEAEKVIRDSLPQEPYQFAGIGRAGEIMIPWATIVHSHPYASHSGRGGAGAVMGSKNLKAIAVRGTRHPFGVAKQKQFETLGIGALKALKSWNQYETWRRWGTACLAEAGSDAGILASKNFREGTFKKITDIGAVQCAETYWIRSEACYYCPLHCRKVALLKDKKNSGSAVAGPELETIAMLGANCGVNSLNGIIAAKDKCDRLGMDQSSAGNTIAFLMEAVEKGLVNSLDLDGIDLKWGAAAAMISLLDLIGKDKAAAETLGQGVRDIAKKLGGGSEKWAMEVKGLEMDTYNVPALPALVTAYCTSNIGAAHEMGHSIDVQNQRAVTDSLGLCRFHTYANPVNSLPPILSAITGEEWTVEDLIAAGERVWNLERAFNSLEGFGLQDDLLPERCKTDAFTLGPKAGATIDKDFEGTTIINYYNSRGWDASSGAPLASTLSRLGMDDVADRLKGG